ncbi:MAG: acetyl-CoA acetyltransferase [Deltaproteobacteria bacterium]|nr:MAG: acetyl-CoA acetyltransferase [Deltaproteobacteria bacterium]
MPDRRSPVLVGVAQLEQRVDDPAAGLEPLELMLEAVRRAAAECGRPGILEHADSVRVIKGLWPYENPARVLAERIGAPGAQTVGTPFGGNMVQHCVNHAARAIRAGELDVVVLTGAENGRSRARLQKAGTRFAYSAAPGTPDLVVGSLEPLVHPAEVARNTVQAIQIYAIFENAIRHARGESLADHSVRISELWERFNAVAAANPHAWIRTRVSAEAIRTPSPDNRMICFPYPKLLNSNNSVDQGAALILCSLEKAEALGCDPDAFVFQQAGTDAHDQHQVSHRDNLYSSPAMRLAGRRALELAGTSPDAIEHVDVYSCFPSAVQIAAAEIGLSEGRPLTVTGGMTFAGGPLNNYVMHAIARMAEVLRADRGSRGLVTANGGYLSKHAFGVYSTEPPDGGFAYEDLQAQVDAYPSREVVEDDYQGPATLESYTVMYRGEAPVVAHTACRLEDGRRIWANAEDPELCVAMTREEFCGRAARIESKGVLRVD